MKSQLTGFLLALQNTGARLQSERCHWKKPSPVVELTGSIVGCDDPLQRGALCHDSYMDERDLRLINLIALTNGRHLARCVAHIWIRKAEAFLSRAMG
jgi:hypothetical protein